MAAEIINRGRGPEIKGTRVTVYRIMDFVREGSACGEIAAELDLTVAEVQAALEYIASHQHLVEKEYERILVRNSGSNPESIVHGGVNSIEELKKRIVARREQDHSHADSAG